MAARTYDDARRWTAHGTRLLREAAAGLDDAAVRAPSGLPDWTRGHLLAHVAANADALGNLVRWAATGVESPMYASPRERAAGIARGAGMPAAELRTWLADSAEALDAAMDALTGEQWQRPVVTAQGRTVPAAEIPWLRAREVCVHAADLGLGAGLRDLPEGFLAALAAEITAKRGLLTVPEGPLPEVAAWLAGRPHTLPGAPALGPWI